MANKPMSTFFSALRNGAKLLERRDDDGFDRLSNRYSIGLLVMMAGFISVKSYVGEPIVCFPPAEFTIQWRKYVDNMCWTTNTYYVPLEQNLMPSVPPGASPGADPKYQQEINYYQWVPIILTFCAFMFAIPAQIWDWASNSGGYDVEAMVKATKGATNLNPEVRDKTVKYLVAQMDRLLGYRRPLPRKGLKEKMQQNGLVFGKRFGSFLFFMYLFVKLLYIANAVSLLWLLDVILGEDDYHYYGIQKLMSIQDPEYRGTQMFPYSTLCDFSVRRNGENIHRYTVQCVLPVNLFNEKIFVVLWFWLVLVAALSVVGFILWIGTGFSSVNRGFAKKYLTIMGRATKRSEDDDLIREFVENYLRLDGVFCMRLIIKNTNDATGGEILAACWDHFLQSRKPSFDPTIDSDLLKRRSDSDV